MSFSSTTNEFWNTYWFLWKLNKKSRHTFLLLFEDISYSFGRQFRQSQTDGLSISRVKLSKVTSGSHFFNRNWKAPSLVHQIAGISAYDLSSQKCKVTRDPFCRKAVTLLSAILNPEGNENYKQMHWKTAAQSITNIFVA